MSGIYRTLFDSESAQDPGTGRGILDRNAAFRFQHCCRMIGVRQGWTPLNAQFGQAKILVDAVLKFRCYIQARNYR